MMQREAIETVFRYGHGRNPKCPTNITESDLPKLKLTDKDVQTMFASYQKMYAGEMNSLAWKHHNRPAEPDGEFGPAMGELLQTARCAVPDFATEEAGQGSWPVGCHSEWPNNHTFAVYVDKSNMPAFLGRADDPDSLFEKVWKQVRAAYADIGLVLIRVDDPRKATSVLSWTRGKGWIGLAIVPQQFGCNTSPIWLKLDTSYGSNIAAVFDQICRLLAHELGHNMGWGHTSGGILNSYIVTGPFTKTAWRGDPNERRAVKHFGGVPVDLGDGPDEPDEPDDPIPPWGPKPRYTFHGSVTMRDRGEDVGSIRLVNSIKA